MNNPITSEYKREYVKKEADVADQELRNVIKKNNVDSHLKNVVGNKEGAEQVKRGGIP